jgi:hypothetical protein
MEKWKILALFDVGEAEAARGFSEGEMRLIFGNTIETDKSFFLQYKTPFGLVDEPLVIKTDKVPLLFGLLRNPDKEYVLIELDNNYTAKKVIWKGSSEECEHLHQLYSLPRYLLEEEEMYIELGASDVKVEDYPKIEEKIVKALWEAMGNMEDKER